MSVTAPPQPTQRTMQLIAAGAVVATVVLLALIFGNLYNIENPDHFGHFPWLVSALFWIGVGTLTWRAWRGNLLGPVMVLGGFAHFGYAFGLIPTPLTWTIGWFTGNMVVLVVAYLFLAYPGGRLRDDLDRRLYLAIVAWWVVSAILGILSTEHELNPVWLVRDESTMSLIGTVNGLVTGILTLIVAVRVVQHWRAAPAIGRPADLPVVLAMVPYLLTEAAFQVERVVGENAVIDAATSWPVFFVQDIALPAAVLYVLLRVAPERVDAATEGATAAA